MKFIEQHTLIANRLYNQYRVAESGHDSTKFSTMYEWFQTLIHPLIQQPHQY